MTGPFQTVLGQIPKGVLAGLFAYMGKNSNSAAEMVADGLIIW